MKSVKKHSQIARLVVSSLTFLFLFTFSLSAQGDVKAGKSLFNANCAACHKLDKKLVGPALGKISDGRELDWLKAWIKDNNALRATGDADAIAIYEEYKGSPMTSFPQLSDADIVNIVSYLDADPVKKAGATAVVAVAEVKEEGSSNLISYVVFLVLAGLIVYVYFKSDNGFLDRKSVV